MSVELSPVSVYAGFWRRVAAALIDAGLLLVLLIVLGHALGQPGFLLREDWFPSLLSGLVSLAYGVLFESSAWQATPGKRLIRIKVTDLAGQRISRGRAVLRHLAQLLSALCLMLGYVMAAFTQRRQCLHDKIAGTLVVRAAYAPAQIASAPMARRWSRWEIAAVIGPLVAAWLAVLTAQLDHPVAVVEPAEHYNARTQVAAALYYAGDAMDQVVSLYDERHDFASVNISDIPLDQEAARTIAALQVVAGSIHLTFGGDADPALHAHTLTLTPALDTEGNVAWVCGFADVPEGYTVVYDDYRNLTDIDVALLPADCQPGDAGADAAPEAPGLKA